MTKLAQTILVDNYQEVQVYEKVLAHNIQTATNAPDAIEVTYAGQMVKFPVKEHDNSPYGLTLSVDGGERVIEYHSLLEFLYTYMANKYEWAFNNLHSHPLRVEVSYGKPKKKGFRDLKEPKDIERLESLIREAEKQGNDVEAFQLHYEGGSETLTVRMITPTYYFIRNEEGRDGVILRSNLLGDLHDYVVDNHGVYGVEVEVVYEVNEADKRRVYELACEMAGEVLGTSPAYYGAEGDQEVIKQLKRLREAVNGVLEDMGEVE